MARYFEAMQAAVHGHGGVVEKFIGDAVMAVFGVPRLHEDDALRAVRAAEDMRRALGELNAELESRYQVRLEARTGVNTGEVLAADPAAPSAAVMGDAVNVAARLEQAAEPGQILLGETTFRLVRDMVDVERGPMLTLKGKSEPAQVYRLLSIDPVHASAPRMGSPLVGRADELGLLSRAFREAVDGATAIRFALLGPAGIGKSRTAMEFADGLGEEARVLHGRCLPYGEGITFWAARDIVKQAFGIGETDSAEQVRERIRAVVPDGPEAALLADGVAELLGLSEARVGMEETFWAVRRLLEHAAATGPLVLVLDDIHWAEPAFLDLIDYLVGWSEGAPILFLCLGRPELLDARPSWRRRTPREWTGTLEPLSADESATLLTNLMGRGEMTAGVRTRILEAAEGNPLFVEEMLRMLADDDLLRQEEGRWKPVRDLSDLAVPPTINALIGARLDRLGQGERAVTRRASVIGKVFWWGAVAELSTQEDRADVGSHLQTLVRKELIRPERSRVQGEDAFRFHHLLIRDAAYQGTPKAERADLHRRFAGWLERVAADRVGEYEEVIGYHLEQAVLYRAELEPAARERDRELAARAAERLASAGRRAFGRGDMSAAANLLGRAVALLAADEPARLALMPDLAEALTEIGDFTGADRVLDEAVRRAGVGGPGADRGTRDDRSPVAGGVHGARARDGSGAEGAGAGDSRVRGAPRPSRPGAQLPPDGGRLLVPFAVRGMRRAAAARGGPRPARRRHPRGGGVPGFAGRRGAVRTGARERGRAALRGDPGDVARQAAGGGARAAHPRGVPRDGGQVRRGARARRAELRDAQRTRPPTPRGVRDRGGRVRRDARRATTRRPSGRCVSGTRSPTRSANAATTRP